jgi:hypothetical protein
MRRRNEPHRPFHPSLAVDGLGDVGIVQQGEADVIDR